MRRQNMVVLMSGGIKQKKVNKVAEHFKMLIKIYDVSEKASKKSVANFKNSDIPINYDIENDHNWIDKYSEDLHKSKVTSIKESIIKNLDMLSLEETRINKLKKDFEDWDEINNFEKVEDLFNNIAEEIFEQETGYKDPADLLNND